MREAVMDGDLFEVDGRTVCNTDYCEASFPSKRRFRIWGEAVSAAYVHVTVPDGWRETFGRVYCPECWKQEEGNVRR